ncbi:MAG: hypothetical protein Q9174_001543, partial [Haloplaca sp. 1 TL-2023]
MSIPAHHHGNLSSLTPSRSHLSLKSQSSTIPSKSKDPRDGFNYGDHPSQTPSRERPGETTPGSTSKASGDAVSSDKLDEKLHHAAARVYERRTWGTRARHTDDDDVSTHVYRNTTPPQGSSSSSTKSSLSSRRDQSGRSDQRVFERGRNPEKTKVWHVLLNWQRKIDHDDQSIVLNVTPSSGARKIRHHDSVVWQHSDHDNSSLKGLEKLVMQLKPHGLNDNDVGSTKRLLKRVQLVSERAFVAGSFLTPTAVRYIMLNDSRYGVDKRSVFIAFPYFEVKKPGMKMMFEKGDSKHPTRTLLQSRYRLNETTDRDKWQCIRMLDGRALRSYVKIPQPATKRDLTNNIEDEIIYVPQMWALVVDQDHLITTGPVTPEALQGPTFGLEDLDRPDYPRRCTLVRISFMNRGIPENITFPMVHCTSWFGLLNKHQQIRNSLKNGKAAAIPMPMDYPLYIGNQILSGKIWASVQRSVDEQTLELWMDTPKPPKLKVTTAHDGSGSGSGSEASATSGAEEESLYNADHLVGPTSNPFQELDPVPIVKPFLAWRVVDDFDETHECSVDRQVGRFLHTICSWIPAYCVPEASTSAAPCGYVDGKRNNNRPKLMVVGRSRKDADDLAFEKNQQHIYNASSRLLASFVPKDYNKDASPIRLYWGLIYQLINDHPTYLGSLLARIDDINGWAELLHIGVHYKRRIQEAGQPDEYHDDIVDTAILQATMLDALGAIYNLLVETVHGASQAWRHSKQPSVLSKQAIVYSDEACRQLEKARNDLITEAIGTAPGENVGPVVTPEAILIMILERLAQGVFGTGSVDIINILEECLELLALRVEKHSSRRLLQKLNAFEEEVDIVSDVLAQQEVVLLEFRDCLDPTKFERPTTSRKMRFEFETQGIERILTHIREQQRYCKELRERAKVLTVQNVQLVETLVDDNNRAVFVFTLITVLFLPLSFVAGYFGMNLAGIADTDAK